MCLPGRYGFRLWLMEGGIVGRIFKLRYSLWFSIYNFSLHCFNEYLNTKNVVTLIQCNMQYAIY